jgi:hypothetical protein
MGSLLGLRGRFRREHSALSTQHSAVRSPFLFREIGLAASRNSLVPTAMRALPLLQRDLDRVRQTRSSRRQDCNSPLRLSKKWMAAGSPKFLKFPGALAYGMTVDEAIAKAYVIASRANASADCSENRGHQALQLLTVVAVGFALACYGRVRGRKEREAGRRLQPTSTK